MRNVKLKSSIKTGVLRLRHLNEVQEAKDEEMQEQRPRFERLANRQAVQAVSSFNLFQTPAALATMAADRLRELSGGTLDGLRVGEFSAGLGRLIRAAGVRGPEWVIVEESPECCSELYKFGLPLIQADFLSLGPDRIQPVDAVLLNPPFKMGRDIKHIEHAMSFLKPGGWLVSFCFDGKKQNAKLRSLADSWEVLPAGSFKSEGTNAGVALLTWQKR